MTKPSGRRTSRSVVAFVMKTCDSESIGVWVVLGLDAPADFGEEPVFAGAAGVSMAVVYLLSLLCSVYPGWRASRMTPTEALHYE